MKVLLAFTTYNQIEQTRECMEYAQDLSYDIVVVDDRSTDGTIEYLASINVDLLVKSERRGLTDSWNRAYKYFKQGDYDYMILCNNDVIIPKGAIENMLSAYVLTIPMTNPRGAGYFSRFQDINWCVHMDVHMDVHDDPTKTQEIQDKLLVKKFHRTVRWTGFCMCLNRDIVNYERNDGNLFDPANINVGNDDDLARRVPAYIALGSYVYHYKGVSFDGKIQNRNELL